jgi:archaeoflavoprotein AfpA
MSKNLVWAITGAGDLLEECFAQMATLQREKGWKITAVLSKAGVTVLKYYKLSNRLEDIAERVMIEKDANTPFIVAGLQTGKYNALVAAPLTSNSAAKIALGLADTLVTNAIAQANKVCLPIYLLPVDQTPGKVTTTMPSGGKLTLTMRPVDIENVDRLRGMPGIEVLARPGDIPLALG